MSLWDRGTYVVLYASIWSVQHPSVIFFPAAVLHTYCDRGQHCNRCLSVTVRGNTLAQSTPLLCYVCSGTGEGHNGQTSTENGWVPAHHLRACVICVSVLPWTYLCRCLNADVTSTWCDGLRRDGMCVAVRHYISVHAGRQTCLSADL